MQNKTMKVISFVVMIITIVITIAILAQDSSNLNVSQNIKISNMFDAIDNIKKEAKDQEEDIKLICNDMILLKNNQKHIIKQIDRVLNNQKIGRKL